MEKTIIKLLIKAFIFLFIGTFLMAFANCGTILGALVWATAWTIGICFLLIGISYINDAIGILECKRSEEWYEKYLDD